MKSKFITLTLHPTRKKIVVNTFQITHIREEKDCSEIELTSGAAYRIYETTEWMEAILNDN